MTHLLPWAEFLGMLLLWLVTLGYLWGRTKTMIERLQNDTAGIGIQVGLLVTKVDNHHEDTGIHINPVLEGEFRTDVRKRLERIECHLMAIKRNGGSL